MTITAPNFSAFDVLSTMIEPGKFRPLNASDRECFCGAPDEALIGEMLGNWQVIVSIGEEEGHLMMEAIGFDPATGDMAAYAWLPCSTGIHVWTKL